MKKHLTILAAAAVATLAMSAGPAPAQTYDPDNRCTVRFADDPNAWIARLEPGYGGNISCDAIPADMVQYDTYGWENGGFKYQLSVDVACAAIQTGDPDAYAKFCQ